MSNSLNALIKLVNWYNRRRGIVKFLIFFILFILPVIVYSYMNTEVSLVNEESESTTVTTTAPQYKSYSFTSLVKGKKIIPLTQYTVYDMSISKINSTNYLYRPTPYSYGLLVYYANNSKEVIIISYKSPAPLLINGTKVKVVTLLLPSTPPPDLPDNYVKIVCSTLSNYNSVGGDPLLKSILINYSHLCKTS